MNLHRTRSSLSRSIKRPPREDMSQQPQHVRGYVILMHADDVLHATLVANQLGSLMVHSHHCAHHLQTTQEELRRDEESLAFLLNQVQE